MPKLTQTALLAVILLLGVCYGQERADAAKREAQLTQLKAEALAAEKRTAELTFSYARERQRGDSLQAIAAFASRRRGRAVASSEVALSRVDTVALSVSRDTLAPLVLDLRKALLVERDAASVVILSLEQTVAAKDVAIQAADSVIASQGKQIEVAKRALEVALRRPPWYRRAVDAATKVAIGAAIGAALLR